MFYICILYSKSKDHFYTGYTEDVGDRFIRHNQGRSKSTKSGIAWRLVHAEQLENRPQATQREK